VAITPRWLPPRLSWLRAAMTGLFRRADAAPGQTGRSLRRGCAAPSPIAVRARNLARCGWGDSITYMPSVSRKKVGAALANTAVAALLTGPAGGLGEAARQAIALAANTGQQHTADDILRRLRKSLEEFAVAEHVPDTLLNQAFLTAELAIRRGGLSVAECLDLSLDPHRIANRVLGRVGGLLADLDEGAADITRRIIRAVYDQLLTDPQALPELEREFQRYVVTRLAQLRTLPEETARAIHSLAPTTMVTSPRRLWDGSMLPESSLLRAEFAVVPFHGREHTMEELDDWCTQGPTAAFRLYTGTGGMGKTRLMMEACGRMRARGWRAGFIAGDAGAWGALFGTDAPLLVTVDYAELERLKLRVMIEQTLRRTNRRHRTRLVALARGRGDWWQDLTRTGHGVGDFLRGPATSVRTLTPVAPAPEQRADSFRLAARSFAACLSRPSASTVSEMPDMSPGYFDRVLFVHLAALAVVLGQDPGDENALLDFALRREHGFWDDGVVAAGFADLRGRAVLEAAVVATLAGRIGTREEAIQLIGKAPALAGQRATAVAALAELLHALYPGDGWLEGVQPDVLGEHLLLRAGQEDPSILRVFDADS
jgi:hypothetical protein